MTGSVASLALALSLAATGGLFGRGHTHHQGGHITPPGPGLGWGFPNGNPDGYGWVDFGTTQPQGANRITDYYARRYFFSPADQTFMPTYYNPYVMRGQRYVPYAGCGGAHPFGQLPTASAEYPMTADVSQPETTPVVPVPEFNGDATAPAVPSGTSGMIP